MSIRQNSRTLLIKRVVGASLFAVFLALMIWICFSIGMPLIDALFGDGSAAEFRAIVDNRPILGRLIFIGIQVMQVFVAFIPGEAVELAAGVVFGTWEGLLLAMIGIVIGSAAIFLLTKTLGLKFIGLFVDVEKLQELRFLRNSARLNTLVFIIFLIPGTPKDLLTYFVGLTKMRFCTFMLIALVARIPSVITSTWCGNELIEGNYTKAVIIFAATAAAGLVGLFIYHRISHASSAQHDAAPFE